MAGTTQTSSSGADLRARIGELTRRWLPMLLSRAGVPQALTLRLREGIEDARELRSQLEFARFATLTVKQQNRTEDAELAASALEVISDLIRALDLPPRDLGTAERLVDDVNRRLLGLLVGLPDGRPRVTQGAPAWWSRLVARTLTAGSAAY